MTDRTTRVRLEAVITGYQTAMTKAAASTRQFAGQSEADLNRLGSQMQSLGTRMSLAVTGPLVLLAKQSVDTAMTAQESTNRMNVVFGENAKRIEAWSQDSVRNMGLARHEAFGTAATFKNMFDEMGLAEQAAFGMSTGMVQLAADIGSFRDVDPSEMLTKLRAGIIGEYEPLRALGIVLDDNTVRLKAVEMGLAETTTEVDTAAKVQARYAIILQQTSKDQGDFARTNEDATNAARIASAAWKDASAELGENLLPLVAEGALTLADLAEAFQSMPEGAQSTLLAVGGLVAAMGPLLLVSGSVIRNLQTVTALGPRAVTALKFAGVAAGAWAAAAAIEAIGEELRKVRFGDTNADQLAKSMLEFADSGEVAGEMAKAFGSDLNDLEAAFGRLWEQPGMRTGAAALVDWINGDDTLPEAKKRIEDLDQTLAGFVSSGHPKKAAELMAMIAENIDVDPEQVQAALDDYNDALARNEAQQLLTGDAATATGGAFGEQGSEAKGAAGQVDDFTKALDELYTSAFAVDAAQRALDQDLERFADTVAAATIEGNEFATSLDNQSTTGMENADMLQGLVRGALDVVAAMERQGVESDVIAAKLAEQRSVLLAVADSLGFSRDEALRYIGVLDQVPTQVGTVVVLDTQQAYDALTRLASAANSVLASIGNVSIPWLAPVVAGLQARVPIPVAPPPIPAAVRRAIGGGGSQGVAARDSAAAGGRSAAGAAARAADDRLRALEEAEQKRRAVIDNAFEEGLYAFDDYLTELERRRDQEEHLTDAWQTHNDAIKRILDERAEATYDAQADQQQIEDFQYAAGAITARGYRLLVEHRTAA